MSTRYVYVCDHPTIESLVYFLDSYTFYWIIFPFYQELVNSKNLENSHVMCDVDSGTGSDARPHPACHVYRSCRWAVKWLRPSDILYNDDNRPKGVNKMARLILAKTYIYCEFCSSHSLSRCSIFPSLPACAWLGHSCARFRNVPTVLHTLCTHT